VRTVLLLLIVGCGSSATGLAGDAPRALDSTIDGEGQAADAASADAAPLVIHNPVQTNCADPGVLREGDHWYLTCTGGSGGNLFPIYESTDLLHWTQAGWIFPAGTGPSWASGNYWAPELHVIGGQHVAYFAALDGAHNAVGVATAPSVLGPYTDRGTPLVARSTSVIDPHAFVAPNGAPYLYFKLEGAPDTIWGHGLTGDGTALVPGSSTQLLAADATWEHGVVEAPWMIESAGTYYLMYSGGAYCNSTYAVGVARGASPLGPFAKRSAPILPSGTNWVGPGHNSVTVGPDGLTYIVYHAYHLTEGTPTCATSSTDNNHRHTLIDRMVISNGWPDVLSNL